MYYKNDLLVMPALPVNIKPELVFEDYMGDENSAVLKCQNGELEAFGTLYELYIEKIYRFIFYRIRDKETAEDLVSETFFKALEKIKSFNLDKGNFSSWIYTIARNTLIDYFRKNSRFKKSYVDDIFEFADSVNFTENIDAKKKLSNVENYMENLTEEQRSILVMRVWDDMPFKEIAKVLGKSEASCKMAFGRLIAKIKKEFPGKSDLSLALAAIFLVNFIN